MRRLKLTKELQQRFLEALADTGSVSTAVSVAGTSRTRVYELRKSDPTFASAWQEAEEIAADRLEDEARRRPWRGYQNFSSARANLFAMMKVNRSLSGVTRITYS
jgi:hypothetical protein